MERSQNFCLALAWPLHRLRLLPAWALASCLLASPCLAAKTLKSRWAAGDIVIDGVLDDWPVGGVELKKTDFTAGVRNDGASLYLYLTTKDTSRRRQILVQGLEMWIDGTGGQEKTFGVRFPMGLRRMRESSAGASGGGPDGSRGSGRRRAGVGEDRMRQLFERGTSELEVLGPDPEVAHRYRVAEEGHGLEVAALLSGDSLVLELKLPLRTDGGHPFAPEVEAGESLSLGLLASAMEGARQREGGGSGRGGGGGGGFGRGGGGGFGGGISGGGGGGGGRGGPGGGRGGGGAARGGSEGLTSVKALEGWFELQLAAPEKPEP